VNGRLKGIFAFGFKNTTSLLDTNGRKMVGILQGLTTTERPVWHSTKAWDGIILPICVSGVCERLDGGKEAVMSFKISKQPKQCSIEAQINKCTLNFHMFFMRNDIHNGPL
jgi:hypothetical protein